VVIAPGYQYVQAFAALPKNGISENIVQGLCIQVCREVSIVGLEGAFVQVRVTAQQFKRGHELQP
jgi:hypothetical protein